MTVTAELVEEIGAGLQTLGAAIKNGDPAHNGIGAAFEAAGLALSGGNQRTAAAFLVRDTGLLPC
jgi:hypothetical protein